jgi:uncharacterized protein DUF4158
LCLLKTFPVLGRFPAPEDIPDAIVEYIAKRAGLEGPTLAKYPKRTRARHRIEIRRHLGIHRWGGAAESLAIQTIERVVAGRAHLSPARRRTMLACLIQRTRATRLDDMVTMLARFIGRIEAKARAELEAWHLDRRVDVVEMVGVLHDTVPWVVIRNRWVQVVGTAIPTI